ncbi:MAG: phenylalanine--tRNA ligase subunit alpha [Myxococcota bacterium]
MSEQQPPQLQQVSDQLQVVKQQAIEHLQACQSIDEVHQIRVRYLGKKGALSDILRGLGSLSSQDRPAAGKQANEVLQQIQGHIQQRLQAMKQELQQQNLQRQIDISLPGRMLPRGHEHPIVQTQEDILQCLRRCGFDVVQGPEVEHDFLNFTALNMPPGHPARQMQDTFYLSDDVVLRTHTSPVQIRVLSALKNRQQPRVQIASPGRVYRRDDDATHSPVFHQVEGLCVGPDVTFAQLKGLLAQLAQQLFTPSTRMRTRSSYFPFTEPSVEVDVSCPRCSGDACSVCKGTGWLELMGAGMVDPAVFETVGIDSETTCGFAFGMGVERVAMLRHGVTDIRLFYSNDIEFLQQF